MQILNLETTGWSISNRHWQEVSGANRNEKAAYKLRQKHTIQMKDVFGKEVEVPIRLLLSQSPARRVHAYADVVAYNTFLLSNIEHIWGFIARKCLVRKLHVKIP